MKKYPIILLSLFFSYTYAYYVTSSHLVPCADFNRLKDTMIAHPETLVTTTHTLSHQAKVIKNSAALQDWINHNEPLCPIALLSECTSSGCRLSRLDGNNYKRNRFDELAAERLATLKSTTGNVNYVSFASGGGLNDLRILTLAHERGLEKVTIHLIDPSYASCITRLKNKRSSDIISALHTDGYRAHSIKEFISYVTHLFGPDNLKVHIYGSGQEYLTTLKIVGAYAADLAIGIDFDPSKKTYKGCIHDFIKIIEHGSKQALHLHGNGIFHIAPKGTDIPLKLSHDPQKNRYSKNVINHALLF